MGARKHTFYNVITRSKHTFFMRILERQASLLASSASSIASCLLFHYTINICQ